MSEGMWYDKDGNPLPSKTPQDWERIEELLSNPDYKRVGYTKISPYFVSTVWMGIDHSFALESPVIFETMVFSNRISKSKGDLLGPYSYHKSFDEFTRRYHSLAEAEIGHELVVAEVRRKIER